jgi:glycine betaine/proline transport system substrate-binding protein
MIKRKLAALLTMATVVASGGAWAADAAKCRLVRMSDPGWSDISATNALAGIVLKGLGYEQRIDTLGVPVIYKSLSEGIIDVFLGNWMPAQKMFVEPLIAEHRIKVLRKNLGDLKFTLAVPSYVAEDGVRSVEDLAKHAKKFDRKIYGIEPGAPINQNAQAMIKAGDYDLGGWEVIESSEQAMLAQVERASRQKKWVAFVGWEPHPMNTKLKMTYLSGGEKAFGPNYGASDVFTVARKGFTDECPNLARLFGQFTFTVDMENQIMAGIEADRRPDEAARAWLTANPATIKSWVEGVTTIDGKDGLSAVMASLQLQ